MCKTVLYCTIMADKHTDSSYNHSHKKNAKSFAKALCKALDIKQRIGTKFTASQLHSFTASQLHSFTASQLHSFTASQLHSFTASQLRGTCAQIKTHPKNKFTHTIRTRQKYCPCAFFWNGGQKIRQESLFPHTIFLLIKE